MGQQVALSQRHCGDVGPKSPFNDDFCLLFQHHYDMDWHIKRSFRISPARQINRGDLRLDSHFHRRLRNFLLIPVEHGSHAEQYPQRRGRRPAGALEPCLPTQAVGVLSILTFRLGIGLGRSLGVRCRAGMLAPFKLSPPAAINWKKRGKIDPSNYMLPPSK
jgi:hypothetical protein